MEFDKEALESGVYQAPTLSSLEDKRKQTIDNLLLKTQTSLSDKSDKNFTEKAILNNSKSIESTIFHILQYEGKSRTPEHKAHFQKHYPEFLKKVGSCKDPEVLKQMYSIFIAVKEQRPLNQDQVDLLLSFGLKNRESIHLININLHGKLGPIAKMQFSKLDQVTIDELFEDNFLGQTSNSTYKKNVERNSFNSIVGSDFEQDFSINPINLACERNIFNNYSHNTFNGTGSVKDFFDNIFTGRVYKNTFRKNTAEEIRENNIWDDALDANDNSLTFKTFEERNTFLNLKGSELDIKTPGNNKVHSFPNLS